MCVCACESERERKGPIDRILECLPGCLLLTRVTLRSIACFCICVNPLSFKSEAIGVHLNNFYVLSLKLSSRCLEFFTLIFTNN